MDTNLTPLDRLPAPDLSAEVSRRLRTPPRPVPAPPRAGRRITTGVVAFVVFAVAGGFAWLAFRHDDGSVPATDPWAWAPEGWTELPSPPEWHDGAAIVWTGSELFVWGGTVHGEGAPVSDSGAMFDPATQTWTEVSPAPVGIQLAHGVWTGTEILVFGSNVEATDVPPSDFDLILVFDPVSGSWRQLPASPHLPEWSGTWAWTGSELVVVGGGRPEDATAVTAVALDPSTGVWRSLPDAPMPLTLGNAAWTGEEVLVVGAAQRPGNVSTTQTAVALAYRPATDKWRILPDPPLSPQASDVVRFSDRVIAWDYGADSVEYIVGEDRWRGLGRLPLDHGECYVSGAATPDAVFAWNCGYPDAWFPDAGWRDVEGGPAPDVPVERVVGTIGWLAPAGSVAIVQQVDSIERGGDVILGDDLAPEHLWAWRAPAEPPPPRPVTSADAVNAVDRFLGAWAPGFESYLPTMAPAEIIERCQVGSDGVPSLEGWTYRSWNTGEPEEIAAEIWDVEVELRRDGESAADLRFRVAPGVAADGSSGQVMILDVEPA